MGRAEFPDEDTLIFEPYELVELMREDPPTRVIRLEGALGADEKVVVGYLTLEQQGWFADMSQSEQVRAIETLRRS